MVAANDGEAAPGITRRGAPAADPQERRRLIAAHFNLLRQLEAEAKRVGGRQLPADDGEVGDGIDGGEALAGGECWLSKLLALSLSLAVGVFVVVVVTAHQQQLRVLFT